MRRSRTGRIPRERLRKNSNRGRNRRLRAGCGAAEIRAAPRARRKAQHGRSRVARIRRATRIKIRSAYGKRSAGRVTSARRNSNFQRSGSRFHFSRASTCDNHAGPSSTRGSDGPASTNASTHCANTRACRSGFRTCLRKPTRQRSRSCSRHDEHPNRRARIQRRGRNSFSASATSAARSHGRRQVQQPATHRPRARQETQNIRSIVGRTRSFNIATHGGGTDGPASASAASTSGQDCRSGCASLRIFSRQKSIRANGRESRRTK